MTKREELAALRERLEKQENGYLDKAKVFVETVLPVLRDYEAALGAMEEIETAMQWAIDIQDIDEALIKEHLPERWASLNHDALRRAKAKFADALAALRNATAKEVE